MAKPTDTKDALGDFIEGLESSGNDPLGDFIEDIETGSPDLLGDFIESITSETDETAPKPESKPPPPGKAPLPPPQKPEQKTKNQQAHFAKAPDVSIAFQKTDTDTSPTAPSAGTNIRHYKIAGQTYTMTPDVYEALKTLETRDGFPFSATAAIAARESSMKAGSLNPTTKAAGLFQFMTNETATLYEVTWKYAEQYGYDEARKLVTRDIHKNKDGKSVFTYRPVSDAAKETLINDYALNAQYNADMWAAYKKPHVEAYNNFLGNRTISGLELVLMNNIGRGGMQALFTQVMEDGKKHGSDITKGMLAVDFFKQQGYGDMQANKSLIYNQDGSHKTVRQAYNDIAKFAGYEELVELAAPKQETAMLSP